MIASPPSFFFLPQNIVHRDIKPGNLLIDKASDSLLLTDFGVAELFDPGAEIKSSSGTAIFLAPEMTTGKAFKGPPVDMWAAGVTLFMFVYGRPPFTAPTCRSGRLMIRAIRCAWAKPGSWSRDEPQGRGV